MTNTITKEQHKRLSDSVWQHRMAIEIKQGKAKTQKESAKYQSEHDGYVKGIDFALVVLEQTTN